jgi:hypothetical protein
MVSFLDCAKRELERFIQLKLILLCVPDIKTPITSLPVNDQTIVVDTSRLHAPSGRGHHRKASSVSSHITPRSSRPSSGHDTWTGDWKEGKEW